jgi:isopenicillin-N epimerase
MRSSWENNTGTNNMIALTGFRQDFLLAEDVVFLNHGSFGACPKPVFEQYQAWQLELERQPVEFLGRRADSLLDAARAVLANYLNAPLDELIFVPNATLGLNTFIRSLMLRGLKPGDEILTTDHEYGALDHTWEFVERYTGAKYIHRHIPVPVTTHADFVEHFWAGVTPQTKIIFLSHITSPTALTFPVEEICRRARAAGIMTIIDGAHVPGQLPLDITALGADVYSGNLHKWLCSPKGSAFLHVRAEHHRTLEPLVISHGWVDDGTFVSRNQWQGTRDISAFLTVPAAIEYQQQHNWEEVRAACHTLAQITHTRIHALLETEPIYPNSSEWFMQMVHMTVPDCDIQAVKARLYDEFRIEIPWIHHNGRVGLRASFQAYNTPADVDALETALRVIFLA